MDMSANMMLKQTGKLTMTQQLLQSIELLQLSNVELAEKIASELIENPVLEEENPEALEASNEVKQEFLATVDKELSGDDSAIQRREEIEKMYEQTWSTPYDSYNDEIKRSYIENAVTQKETLKEHLLTQASLTAKNKAEYMLLETIITSLDDNGFLVTTPEDIAGSGSFDLNKVKDTIAIINTFDPVGCGVQTIKESLIIQAEQLYPDDDILLTILKKYFHDLEKLNYVKIASSLHISPAEVIRKSRLVHNLDPFPGIKYSSKNARYIIPDIEVKYIDGEVIVVINDEWIPKIKINSYYRNILKKKPVDNKLAEYLKNKIQSAKNLMTSISNRRTTIVKVVGAIMEHQRDFLIYGAGHLKPLIYLDIARIVGLHESTISRIANNKFVQTSWGIFELKYFFVSKLKSQNSTEHSSDEIMNLMKEIIAMEDPANPVSDLEILNELKNKGINIARRTIAKYRTVLNISSSNIRKKLNFIKNEERK